LGIVTIILDFSGFLFLFFSLSFTVLFCLVLWIEFGVCMLGKSPHFESCPSPPFICVFVSKILLP
jgi:hypothetical protein